MKVYESIFGENHGEIIEYTKLLKEAIKNSKKKKDVIELDGKTYTGYIFGNKTMFLSDGGFYQMLACDDGAVYELFYGIYEKTSLLNSLDYTKPIQIKKDDCLIVTD